MLAAQLLIFAIALLALWRMREVQMNALEQQEQRLRRFAEGVSAWRNWEKDMIKPEDLWRDLCEDDRTSHYPDMALITKDELVSLLQQYGDERAREARAAAIEEVDQILGEEVWLGDAMIRIRALAAKPGSSET